MHPDKLKNILKSHQKWVSGKGGEPADLRNAYLKDANLEDVNLQDAYLWGANLEDVNLKGANLKGAQLWCANLKGANLTRADLWGANLKDAYLTRANLRYANLWGANLTRTDLWGANLRYANLKGANLWGANLRYADLRSADLWGANLKDADLTRADLPHFQICPSEGVFIAWKAAAEIKGKKTIIKLLIPADAQRTSSLVGRKCRASHVEVLEIIHPNNPPEAPGCHDGTVIYRVGETVHADKFDDDIRIECTNGIHFFMTRKEAEEW